jgi:5-hydroxyisourate hydrolase
LPAQTSISTHILDVEGGRPADGVTVELYRDDELLAARETDDDGRIGDFVAGGVEPGTYRIVFYPASSPFFRRVEVEVAIEGAGKHFHVPLLLAPYSCTVYRGS